MFSPSFLPTLIVTATTLGSLALTALSIPTSPPAASFKTKRACEAGVDISNPLLPHLDYPAFRDAAAAAISALETYRSTGTVPAVRGTALQCDRIRVRKEWRRLTRKEKKAYMKAERCLMTKPEYGLTGNATYSFHDGLTAAHADAFFRFHAGTKFLPWHRWLVWSHGYALEKLCGYTGPVPYWDYTLDAGPNIYKAPVFSTDPEIGFGNGGSVAINELGGRAGGFKVDNGAFANYRPNLPIPHFLVRNFTPDALYNPDNKYGIGLSDTFNKTARDRVLTATTFWEFETMIDGLDEPQFRSLHNSVHYTIGGDGQSFNFLEGTPWIGSKVFGGNDPLFYLHHANVDHVWWEWQNKKAEYQYDFRGREGATDSICDDLPLNGLGPDIPIGLSLKTEWYPQCYTYEY